MPSWAPDPTVGTETPYSPLPSICAGRQECRQVEVVGASGGELRQGSHWVLHTVGSEAADWVLGRQLCHGAGGLHGPACCCCHSSWWPWWSTWSAGVLTSPHSEGRWGKTRGKQRQACVFLRWFLGALAFVYRAHTHTHTHTHTSEVCSVRESGVSTLHLLFTSRFVRMWSFQFPLFLSHSPLHESKKQSQWTCSFFIF